MDVEKPRKTDRRTLYTRMVIREAYLYLLHRRSHEQITVTDICKRAEINRSTFYLHYQDAQAVFDEILEEVIDQLRDSVLPDNVSLAGRSSSDTYWKNSEETYQRIMGNEQTAFLLKKGMSYMPFVEKLADALARASLPAFRERGKLEEGELLMVLTGLNYAYLCIDNYYLKNHSVKELEACNALLNRFLVQPCYEALLEREDAGSGGE